MDITLPIFQDLELKLADKPEDRNTYPTSRLQKGLVLKSCGVDLSEEAVGFGLPVLKKGLQTVFPGTIRFELQKSQPNWVVKAVYTMNLVEKIAKPGTTNPRSGYLYTIKNYLAALIRRCPPVRAPLTALSNGLRDFFGWETTYEDAGFSGEIKIIYSFDEVLAGLRVEVDMASLPLKAITDVIVMNEQGAHYFDQYRDSSGIRLAGKEISCWDEVTAEEASFTSSTQRVAFSLAKVTGVRLFRGRELIGSRLAWAGFGYSIPPTAGSFDYTIRFEKLL